MPSSPENTVAPRSLPAWAQWLFVLLPPLVAYMVLARFYSAIPIIDDYPELFAFAIDFHKASGAMAKVAMLFTAQIGPYKLITDHAVVAAQLLLFGHMSLPAMIVLGNLMPLGTLWVIARNTEGSKRHLLLLLPVSLLLFSLNYAETLDWAMIGLQHPAVIFFTLLSLHYLVMRAAGAKELILACGFAVLACATSANGLLLWPVGFGYLLMHDRRSAKLAAWGSSFAITCAVYFYHFQPAALAARASIFGKLLFLVMFSGGALENMHHRPIPYISVVVGLFVLGVFLQSVRTRFDKRRPFFFFTSVWVLLTAAVVANARIGMGLELSLSSRYKIFCDLLLVLTYEYLLDSFSRRRADGTKALPKWFLPTATAVALVVFLGGAVAGGNLLAVRKARSEAALTRYYAAPMTASPMFVVEDVLRAGEVQDQDRARDELNEAIKLGIYKPPVLR
jgi:hypothetical protein